MTYGTEIKSWVLRIALFLGVLNFSCSAETKVGSNSEIGAIPTGVGTSNGTRAGNTGGTAGSNGAATTTDFTLGPNTCAGANVQASRIKPTVLFVVDRSGSTSDPYPGSTSRWQAIYDALMDSKAGVVTRLQSVARFGMVLFDGPLEAAASDVVNGVFCLIPGMPCQTPDAGQPAATTSCPRLVIVNPALDNYTAIQTAYQPAGPAGGLTPTARSLEAAYKLIREPDQRLDQRAQGPAFVVLCTDGKPNGCIDSVGIPDEQGPIDQLTAAAKNGIKTYVVGVAADAEAQTYLDKLATFGDTGAPAFSPASKDDLVAALSQIVGGAVGCNVRLNGSVVPGQECSGTVNLNSQPLGCNDANGWKLTNESEIELQGSACQKFMNDPAAMISATFPCNAFVLE